MKHWGDKFTKAKQVTKFRNVIHEPILFYLNEPLALDIIPPMELHLLLGVVNHLLKFLKSTCPHLEEWLKHLGVAPEPYHGGQFAGPPC